LIGVTKVSARTIAARDTSSSRPGVSITTNSTPPPSRSSTASRLSSPAGSKVSWMGMGSSTPVRRIVAARLSR
jgi:hypothetical protein